VRTKGRRKNPRVFTKLYPRLRIRNVHFRLRVPDSAGSVFNQFILIQPNPFYLYILPKHSVEPSISLNGNESPPNFFHRSWALSVPETHGKRALSPKPVFETRRFIRKPLRNMKKIG
jgi:hypothetical protein